MAVASALLVCLTLAVATDRPRPQADVPPTTEIAALLKQSTDREPWWNIDDVYSNISDSLPSDDEALWMARYIRRHPDFHAYHLLIALRQYNPTVYAAVPAKDKLAVLVSALRTAGFYNDWGHLTQDSDEFAKMPEPVAAMLECGPELIAYLAPMLNDRRSAEHFGSEDAAVSYFMHYRKCDFAYRFILLAQGATPRFSESIAERDRLIAQLASSIRGTRAGPSTNSTPAAMYCFRVRRMCLTTCLGCRRCR
jgi:hypothetical protein